jgi:hypothetical protein
MTHGECSTLASALRSRRNNTGRWPRLWGRGETMQDADLGFGGGAKLSGNGRFEAVAQRDDKVEVVKGQRTSHSQAHPADFPKNSRLIYHLRHLPPRSPTTSVTYHLGHLPPRSPTTSVTYHLGHIPPRSHTTSVTYHLGHIPPRSHTTSVTYHLRHIPPPSPTTSVTLREVAGSRIQSLRRKIIPVRVCFIDHIHFPSYQALAEDCYSLFEEFRFIFRRQKLYS